MNNTFSRFANYIKTKPAAAFYFLGALAALHVFSKVAGISPLIFGDELFYSNMARHNGLADAAVPNYLYAWIYGTTNLCGTGFYACTKALNVFWLAGYAFFAYLIARRFFDKWPSFILSLVSAIGPMSIFTAFFMPESMYYFFVTAFIWWTLGLSRDSKVSAWAISGAILGLATLVKPQGLFLVPAILVYLSYVVWGEKVGRLKRILINFSTWLISLLLVKFTIGLLLAGPKGITLFGGSYSGTATSIVDGGIAQNVYNAAPVTVMGGLILGKGTLATVFNFGVLHFLTQWVAIFMMLGLAAVFMIRLSVKSLFTGGERSNDSKLALFLLLAFGAYGAGVAAFSAVVSATGDDHSSRPLMRHYEFLIPLAIILMVAQIKKDKVSDKWRWIFGLVGIAVVIYGTARNGAPFAPQFWDTTIFYSFLQAQWIVMLCAVASVAAIFAWIVNTKIGTQVFVWVFAPLFLILPTFAGNNIMGYQVADDPYVRAGLFARDNIAPDMFGELLIVGPSKPYLQKAQFWVDNPQSEILPTLNGATYDLNDTSSGRDYVLAVGNVSISGAFSERTVGNGYVLYKRATPDSFDFSRGTFGADQMITSVEGMSVQENFGRWSIGDTVTIKFSKPLPANAKLQLKALAFGPNAGKQFTADLGGSQGNFTLPVVDQVFAITLPFTNATPSDTLVIRIPQPASLAELNLGPDTRKIGLGLVGISITK